MAYVGETKIKLTLLEEIQRYLAVVDAFRALGVNPTWASENLYRSQCLPTVSRSSTTSTGFAT